MSAKRKEQGFTLLEVLVATTIVGLVFGGVFSAIVVNRDLSFRTQNSFVRDAKLRFQANSIILYSRFGAKTPSEMLSEGSSVEYQEVDLEIADEKIIQTGKLERFSLGGERGRQLQGLIWLKGKYQ